jgi:hypothetical protein
MISYVVNPNANIAIRAQMPFAIFAYWVHPQMVNHCIIGDLNKSTKCNTVIPWPLQHMFVKYLINFEDSILTCDTSPNIEPSNVFLFLNKMINFFSSFQHF